MTDGAHWLHGSRVRPSNTVHLPEAVRERKGVCYYCYVLTGWFNLLGQVAVTAAIEYTLANHLSAMIVLGTGGAGTGGKVITQGQLLGIYAGKASREHCATAFMRPVVQVSVTCMQISDLYCCDQQMQDTVHTLHKTRIQGLRFGSKHGHKKGVIL